MFADTIYKLSFERNICLSTIYTRKVDDHTDPYIYDNWYQCESKYAC